MLSQDKEVSVMNVVPLIDIMLVLLTIVLVTSTFIATGKIPVDLPKAKTAQKTKNTTQEFIEVDSKENIYFHEKIISLEQLEEELHSLSAEASRTQIVLRADKKVTLNDFVTILDMLKGMGFENLNLQAGTNVR
jgi:biopolymer transport protein ExbD